MKDLKKTIFISLLALNSIAGYSQKIKQVLESDLKTWIEYLASDQMRGRANGSPEMKVAADWLAGKFKEFGLLPLSSVDGYLQEYTYKGRQGQITERNVIGMLPGTDPVLKNEYLVVSAHFDHVGVRKGNSSDSVFNGADDNGAGTITLLAIAKGFKESGLKPGRTIVFAAFSGEENGMRGSRFFVWRNTIPPDRIYANVNFEMIGHSESYGKNTFYMTGCRMSDFDDLIKPFAAENKITVIDTIKMANNLFYSSDNISFSRISVDQSGLVTGIPSATFATTTYADYIHSPSDEPRLFDFENMASLTTWFTKMTFWLSNNKSAVNWTDPKFTRPVSK